MEDLKNTTVFSDPTKIESFYVFIPFLVTIGISLIVTNILVILTVYNTPKLRTISNIYVVNLAVTDLLIGAIKIPTYIHFIFSVIHFIFIRFL